MKRSASEPGLTVHTLYIGWINKLPLPLFSFFIIIITITEVTSVRIYLILLNILKMSKRCVISSVIIVPKLSSISVHQQQSFLESNSNMI